MTLEDKKTLRSLSDLAQLLPDAYSAPVKEKGPSGKKVHDGRGKSVRLSLDTKGRKGKRVTIVSGLQHNPATMEDLALALKQYCGAGGTVKGNAIEIQGDQRVRIAEKLRELNYDVKS
jgi:translation initiation factor 1